MSAATDLAPPVWAEPDYLDPTTGRLVTPAPTTSTPVLGRLEVAEAERVVPDTIAEVLASKDHRFLMAWTFLAGFLLAALVVAATALMWGV